MCIKPEITRLYAQISGKRIRINRPLKADAFAIAGHFGVTGGKESADCWKIAKTGGALRIMVKTLRLASMLAAASGAQMDVTHIRAAWDDLKPALKGGE